MNQPSWSLPAGGRRGFGSDGLPARHPARRRHGHCLWAVPEAEAVRQMRRPGGPALRLEDADGEEAWKDLRQADLRALHDEPRAGQGSLSGSRTGFRGMEGAAVSITNLSALPSAAVGLRLAKIFPGDELRLCEPVSFPAGYSAVNTALRRAGISGRVEIEPEGPLPDHFADVLDEFGDMIGHVALDAASFRALKEHWMRCRYEIER